MFFKSNIFFLYLLWERIGAGVNPFRDSQDEKGHFRRELLLERCQE